MRLRLSSLRRRGTLVAAVASALASTPVVAQLRAFTEAEGYGAAATGGRGGSVYHVTNLNDSGPGSFRDAVSASNRIVVFDVGGIINLNSAVSCKSNLTVAGQTAPGQGISLNGYEVSFANQSNIICRYLRFRPGDNSPSSDDCISLYNAGAAGSIILDHVSMEFAKWNNVDAVTDNGGAPNVTIQSSIDADPIGQQFGAHLEAVNGHMTLSNNLWVNGHNRQPLAKVNDQYKNNVIYNYEAAYTTHTSTPFSHDLVNNTFIYGPATGGNTFYQLSSGDTFYASGNVQDSNKDGALNGSAIAPTTGTIVGTPNFATTADLPTLNINQAYSFVTAHAGASLARDELDNLVVSQVQTLGSGTAGKGVGTSGPTGGLYSSALSDGLANGGLGNTVGGSRPAGFDADNDGIADTWEAAHGLSSSNASDAMLLNPLGYRMIEQYINELASTNDTRTSSGGSGNWSSASNWAGGVVPGVMDYAQVRGNGAVNGIQRVSSGTANAMSLSVGGNGPSSGESIIVSGGNLDVYDTLTLGDQNNATLNVSGSGIVQAYNIQLGNTVYLPAATSYAGTINMTGGTLRFSQIVLGAGTPGNWTGGGTFNFSGGTLQPIAAFYANVPIALSSSGGTIDTNGQTGTLAGVISGAGGITKTGAGTLLLTAVNTNTGPTTVKAGTLSIMALANGGAASNLGASTSAAANLVLDGGTLAYAAPGGAASTTTDRTFTLTPVGGTLDGGSGGQWRWLSTADVLASGSGNRTLTLTGSTTLNDFYLGLTDPAAGGKTSLAKIGTGRWILSTPASPRSYSGDTTVSAGTLMTNNDNPLPFGAGKGNLVDASGATFEMNGRNLSINGLNGAGTVNQRGNSTKTLTLGCGDAGGSFSGVISNVPLSGTAVLNLLKTGAGTQTLGGSANTYVGTTTLAGGTLAISVLANGGVASSIGQSPADAANLVLDGGTLELNASGSTDRSLTVTANGGAIITAADATFTTSGDVVSSGSGDRTLVFNIDGAAASSSNLNGRISDPPAGGKLAFYKDGSARLFFNTVAKAYSGDTTINNGALYLGGTDFLPHGFGEGNVVINAAAKLALFNNNTTLNGLSGSGTIDQAGTNTRTLTLGDGDASGSFAGTITGSGLNLTKIGAGTQTLAGANLWSKATTVAGGKLVLGSNLVGGTGVTVQDGATLELAAGSGAVVQTPAVNVSGSGRIDLKDNAMITATPVGSWTGGGYSDVSGLVASGRAGGNWSGGGIVTTFAGPGDYTTLGVATASDALGLASTATTTWHGQTVSGSDTLVRYTYGGDANLDGKLNVDDYGRIDFNVGLGTNGWFNGDFNYDGKVNVDDYGIIDFNIGIQGPPFPTAAGAADLAGVTTVPEPTSLSVLSLAAASLLGRRRSRRLAASGANCE